MRSGTAAGVIEKRNIHLTAGVDTVGTMVKISEIRESRCFRSCSVTS